MKSNQTRAVVWMGIVFVFLYLPIVTLVVLSFNASPMVTSWGGWSLKWYSALADDEEMISGFRLSLSIATLTAFSSVFLGTLAALSLHRFKRFRARTLFVGMVNAPLVMPEVIIGMSLLLLFVGFERLAGWPDRGALTIMLGHTLLGMAYAAVVIESRLQELDRTLEEAAMDLGCRRESVFFLVMLPNMTQALGAAWLLTFTLSFDDVVISEFLSGPGITTLPQVIFGYARRGINPSIYAAAALLMLIVTVSVVVFGVYTARQTAARAREQALGARDAA
jgi:putrescine transport system permease protein